MSRHFRAIAASTAAVLVLGITASPSIASSCDPDRLNLTKHYFAGSQETDYSGVTGIRANIREEDVYVDYLTTGTTAWVMLEGSLANEWAQIGWYEGAFNDRHVFLQYWHNDGNFATFFFDPKTEETLTEYAVNFRYGTTKFKFFADGVLYREANASFNPSMSSVFGETQDRANQMPGIPTD